jgi:hypothetical protein
MHKKQPRRRRKKRKKKREWNILTRASGGSPGAACVHIELLPCTSPYLNDLSPPPRFLSFFFPSSFFNNTAPTVRGTCLQCRHTLELLPYVRPFTASGLYPVKPESTGFPWPSTFRDLWRNPFSPLRNWNSLRPVWSLNSKFIVCVYNNLLRAYRLELLDRASIKTCWKMSIWSSGSK